MSTTKAVGSCIEHEVQRGDWLYDIGRRHNVDLRYFGSVTLEGLSF